MKINFSYKLFVGSYYYWLFASSKTFGVVEDGADCASLEARDGGTGICPMYN
jgi:hypothetical protein